MMKFIDKYKAILCPDPSEGEILPIIGVSTYLRKVISAWEFIELDQPLKSRNTKILEYRAEEKPFWNIHVALAFIADKLQPKSYLEIGVRTGGSMVKVIGTARPEHIVAMDIWTGSYASFPNFLEYTQQQLLSFQDKKGRISIIEYIQGDSHKELKKLIDQNRTFDLITVDGDHSLEGAREDIEDALHLLSARGAIVFDDIIHPSHKYLLGLVYEIKRRHPNLTLLFNTTQDNGCAIFLKNIKWKSLCGMK
jgi:predicted O-methyltransferase YrrM